MIGKGMRQPSGVAGQGEGAGAAPIARLYRDMVRMRRFEEALTDLWWQGRISGELHLGIGEEGIIAGVLAHLRPGDALALDHRPTPALVGWGTDLQAMVLEMLGDQQGLCGGRGGHMHLFDPDRLAVSSGIVGASGPAACGFALAHRRLRDGAVAVAFFGESAVNQGMMMESFNLAGAWGLPVVFVVKDNGWAVTTRSAAMTAGSIVKRAASFGMPAASVDGSKVDAVWRAAGRAIGRARAGKGPAFLHATCRRPRGHFEDDPLVRLVEHPGGIREEIAVLTGDDGARALPGRAAGLFRISRTIARMAVHRYGPSRDPLRRAARKLADQDTDRVDAEALAEVEAAVAAALARAGAG